MTQTWIPQRSLLLKLERDFAKVPSFLGKWGAPGNWNHSKRLHYHIHHVNALYHISPIMRVNCGVVIWRKNNLPAKLLRKIHRNG
jgi:hypothetical protein